MKKSLLIFAVLLTAGMQSQTNAVDSLAGFDEAAAIRASIAEDFRGAELRVHLAQMKRQYIRDKFNLQPPQELFVPSTSMKIAGPACVNEDFESSQSGAITSSTQINGWTIVAGKNMWPNNSCSLAPLSLSPAEATLIDAPNGYIDNVIGAVYPVFSVFGAAQGHSTAASHNTHVAAQMRGDKFIRINSSNPNYSVERLTKTFSVTPGNALFSFAFISVQAAGHQCCDAGGFILQLTNVSTNSLLSTVSYSASGFSNACTYTNGVQYYDAGTGLPASTSAYVHFNKWHVNYIDLSPYIGQAINIEITSADCTAGGHYAYSYFDAQCRPMEIHVNGQNKNSSCAKTATVSGPENMDAYLWNGPNGFTSTAASFTTGAAGVYTLTLPQNPPFEALAKTLNLVISPAEVNIVTPKTTICAGESAVLTATGLANYSWSHSAGTKSVATVKPGSTTTYTLTGSNAESCAGFAMVTVSVEACTGLGERNENAETVLYPNPNNGQFSIAVRKNVSNARLVLTNLLGQEVHSQNLSQGENRITVRSLAAGVYYYSVSDGDMLLTKGQISIE